MYRAFDMRAHLKSATSLATVLLFLVPGVATAQEAVHDWTGPYLGFTFGGAKGTTHFDLSGHVTNSSDIPVLGASGTVTLGVNAQSGNFVYGIAGDGSLLTVKGNGDAAGGTIDTALDQMFALRGRLGLTTGNVLFFATAGLAVGHESFDSRIINSTPTNPRDALGNGYVYGPTYGAGVEVALSDKVSLTAEGLVTNLSSLTASGDTGKSSGGSYTATATHSDVTLRGGLNFHF